VSNASVAFGRANLTATTDWELNRRAVGVRRSTVTDRFDSTDHTHAVRQTDRCIRTQQVGTFATARHMAFRSYMINDLQEYHCKIELTSELVEPSGVAHAPASVAILDDLQ